MEAKPRDQPPADVNLVAAMVRGDGRALGTLFDRHHQSVYRFLARLSGTDSGDLDDLVQNTFVRLVDAAPRFARQASVPSSIWRSPATSRATTFARRSDAAEMFELRTFRLRSVLPDRIKGSRDAKPWHDFAKRWTGCLTSFAWRTSCASSKTPRERTSRRRSGFQKGPSGDVYMTTRQILLRAMSESPAAVKEAMK